MKLESFKYYYAPSGATGVAGICAKPTPQILKLQAEVIAAAKPFMVETGPIGAFTAPHDDPAIDAATYLDKMLAEPFESFTFSPAGAAVYQLGPFGTAAKKLKVLDLK